MHPSIHPSKDPHPRQHLPARRSLTLFLALFFPGLLSGATLYVDCAQSGAETGSQAQPFHSIRAALEAVGEGGSTVVVRPCVYEEAVEIREVDGLVLRSEPPHGAILEQAEEPKILISGSSNVTVRGFEIRGGEEGIEVRGSENVRLVRNWIHDLDQYSYTVGAALRIFSSEGVVIEKNRIENTWGGQSGGCGYISSSQVVLRHNRLRHCLAWNHAGAFDFYHSQGAQIYGNIFDDCRADFSGALDFEGRIDAPVYIFGNLFLRSGADFKGGGQIRIRPSDSAHPIHILNNHFEETYKGGWTVITGIYASAGTTFVNGNIFNDTRGHGIYAYDEAQILDQYNLFSGVDRVGFSSDPTNLFADADMIELEDGTFDLGSGSPAKDAGHPALQFRDADGTRNDIGMRGGTGGCEDPVPGRCTARFTAEHLEPIDSRDVDGDVTIGESGRSITLYGDSWKALPLEYEILATTLLEFSFRSSTPARIQAITLTQDRKKVRARAFQVGGAHRWGIETFHTYRHGDQEWVRYRIPVGAFYRGPITEIGFINDEETALGSESTFADVVLSEGDLRFDFATMKIEPFSAEQFRDAEVSSDPEGRELSIAGNGWVQIRQPYPLSPTSILEFFLESEDPGEVLAVGLGDEERTRLFQLGGRETAGIQSYRSYDRGEPGHRQLYRIPVGRFLTGKINRVAFVVDEDRPGETASATFRDVRILEGDTLVNFEELAIEAKTRDQGTIDVGYRGKSLDLEGGWVTVALPLPIRIDRRTVLRMSTRSSSGVTFAAVGVSDTPSLDLGRAFRLAGERRGLGGYDSDSTWYRTVEIPLGHHLGAGRYRYLVLRSEASDPESESWFSGVRIFQR